MQWHNETQTNLHSLNNGMFEVYFELCCSFVFFPPLCWLIYSVREQKRIPTLSGERKKASTLVLCLYYRASFEYSFLMHLMCNRFCSLCTYTEFTQFNSEFLLAHLILSVKRKKDLEKCRNSQRKNFLFFFYSSLLRKQRFRFLKHSLV